MSKKPHMGCEVSRCSVAEHIVDFGDFKMWPEVFKSSTVKFLNLFEMFPKPDSVRDFETDKKYILDYKTRLGGYSYIAKLKLKGI